MTHRRNPMLNITNPYPSPEAVATIPQVWHFVFTPPTAEDRVKEKIRRAPELRNSFFAKYRSAQRYALEYGTHQEEYWSYFIAYRRAHVLWRELQHQL